MELDRIGHEDWDKKSYGLSVTMLIDDVDYTDYRFEIARLNSFVNWPVLFIDPKKLAAAGFFYTKKNDAVRCFMCLIILSGWVEGDDPMVEHQRWSGKCKFVRNLPCGNVPIGIDPSTIPKMPKRIDTCGLYGVKYMPLSGPDNDLQMEKAIIPGSIHPEINGNAEITVFWDSNTNTNFKAKLRDVLGSKHPTYASFERRLQSFEKWPDTMRQNKKDMAAAGFFLLSSLFEPNNPSDQTMCFYCGGSLKNWEPTDDPVREHVKWYPNCEFIKRVIAEKWSWLEKNDLCMSERTNYKT